MLSAPLVLLSVDVSGSWDCDVKLAECLANTERTTGWNEKSRSSSISHPPSNHQGSLPKISRRSSTKQRREARIPGRRSHHKHFAARVSKISWVCWANTLCQGHRRWHQIQGVEIEKNGEKQMFNRYIKLIVTTTDQTLYRLSDKFGSFCKSRSYKNITHRKTWKKAYNISFAMKT